MMKINIIKIIQILFFIKSIIWFIFGIIHLAQKQTVASVVLSLMFFIDTILFLLLAFYINKGNKWVYYFAVLFLIINIILTITDEFGIYDLIVLVVDTSLLVLLIVKNKSLIK